MSDIVSRLQTELRHPVMRHSRLGEVDADLLEDAVSEIERLRIELAAAEARSKAIGQAEMCEEAAKVVEFNIDTLIARKRPNSIDVHVHDILKSRAAAVRALGVMASKAKDSTSDPAST